MNGVPEEQRYTKCGQATTYRKFIASGGKNDQWRNMAPVEAITTKKGASQVWQPVQTQLFQVYPNGSPDIKIANIYVPPGTGNYDLSKMPGDTCVFGDLNGHTPTWSPEYYLKDGCTRGKDFEKQVLDIFC